jgi:hypothetical protein
MAWLGLGNRVKNIERKTDSPRAIEFQLIIDGKTEDAEGNYTVPYVHEPGAEVIEIRATPENIRWLAEQEVKRKQADEEAEMRRKMAEIGKEDAGEDPALSDYTASQGVPLPAEYVTPPGPEKARHGKAEESSRRIVPEDFRHAEETVAELLERLGY